MRPRAVVLGAGGHARVLVDALRLLSVDIVKMTGDDSEAMKYPPGEVLLVNGVGSVKADDARRLIYEKFKAKGYSFLSVIHPSAIVAKDVEIGEGAQVMAGAVLQPGSHIGTNTIVNTRASVDHDCKIGAHVHLAPGVVLSGSVEIGDGSHLGTAAVVVQGIKIGAGSFVGANSLVFEDLSAGATLKNGRNR